MFNSSVFNRAARMAVVVVLGLWVLPVMAAAPGTYRVAVAAGSGGVDSGLAIEAGDVLTIAGTGPLAGSYDGGAIWFPIGTRRTVKASAASGLMLSTSNATGSVEATILVTKTDFVQNGGFETGGTAGDPLPGWTLVAGGVDRVDPSFINPAEGVYSIDMNGTGPYSAGTIQQSFNTMAGASYLVSFDMAGNAQCGDTVKPITVTAGGVSENYSYDVGSISSPPFREKYDSHAFQFTATASTSTLTFASHEMGSCGAILDNVIVTGPIVDINGNLNAQVGAGGTPLVVQFPAGQYTLVPVISKYEAWSAWNTGVPDGCNSDGNYCHTGWLAQYSLSSTETGEIDLLSVGDWANRWATPDLAFDHAVTASFSLTAPVDVSFFIGDINVGDNMGGLSLLVVTAPPNQPPVAKCQDVNANTYPGTCAANPTVDNGSSDPDGDAVTTSQTPAGPYSPGSTPVTLTATDTAGLTDSCQAVVTVKDAEPPTVSCNVPAGIAISGSDLPISFTATAADNCSATATVTFTGCTMDKNGSATGCSVSTNGATVTISDLGEGKTVHWTATAVDSAGNSTTADCSLDRGASNQGLGNGAEGSDPGNSDQGNPANSNDENGGTPGHPGKKK